MCQVVSKQRTATILPNATAATINFVHHLKQVIFPCLSAKPCKYSSKSFGPKATPTAPPSPVVIMKDHVASLSLKCQTLSVVFCHMNATALVTKLLRLIDRAVKSHKRLLSTIRKLSQNETSLSTVSSSSSSVMMSSTSVHVVAVLLRSRASIDMVLAISCWSISFESVDVVRRNRFGLASGSLRDSSIHVLLILGSNRSGFGVGGAFAAASMNSKNLGGVKIMIPHKVNSTTD
mmetsp:Transcript_6419/g.15916  ORF Transcript_6419/g.15916 Transcript_6419/m.15916 type:complete len:234 (-) Transcript_6419:946-1647(-)